MDFFQSKFLNLTRDLRCNEFVFVHDDLIGNRIDDVGPADAATDAIGKAHFHLFTAVDNHLGDALRGAAVVHRDNNILGYVG